MVRNRLPAQVVETPGKISSPSQFHNTKRNTAIVDWTSEDLVVRERRALLQIRTIYQPRRLIDENGRERSFN